MSASCLRPGQILHGVLFNEPMRVETVRANGPDTWVVGLVGTHSERFRNVTLTSRDFTALTVLDTTSTYAGDSELLRLGLQAYTLGIAHEFDPYFGLSTSRVDPLPHQLEAVYDYLLKLPRVRFLKVDPLPHQLEAVYDYLLKLPRVRFLKVDALTQSMHIREDASTYGEKSS